jgi:cysteinyl-tRNA synthetase
MPPSIEPRASGHITEQIALIQQILDAGMGYQINGSVYFDVEKYNREHHYGILSRRVLEDLQANTRTLDGQDDKRSPFDFALWKKASPEHIMHWPSPWSEGFPGWTWNARYELQILGQVLTFTVAAWLLFPHHECELAQNTVTRGENSVRYWMHNNLITINGQKMGKSLGNFITLEQLFEGTHPLLSQSFKPMTIRFFILQAHYRGPLDFSNEALLAAEKGLQRLLRGRT